MKRYALTLANRMSIGGRNRVASAIACAGVAVALAVMIVTLAVAVGFKEEIVHRLSGFRSDIEVLPPYNYDSGRQEAYLTVTPSLRRDIASELPGARVEEEFSLPAILKTDNDYVPLIFNGLDPRGNRSFEIGNIVAGAFPDFSADSAANRIVISTVMADKLNLAVGQPIITCFLIDGAVRLRKFEVAGIYASNFADYDRTVAYAAQATLRGIARRDTDVVTQLRINGVTGDIADKAGRLQQKLVTTAIAEQATGVPVVDNITHTGSMYLNWLDLLDTNVVVIFALMCCIAACTLVSSLFILILNNVATIGILRSMGVTRRGVSNVFLVIILRIVGLGVVFGNVFALALMYAQRTWHLMPLDPSMYYLDTVPVDIRPLHIVLINIGVIAFAWLLLLLPSRLAATVSPAQTMRYE